MFHIHWFTKKEIEANFTVFTVKDCRCGKRLVLKDGLSGNNKWSAPPTDNRSYDRAVMYEKMLEEFFE